MSRDSWSRFRQAHQQRVTAEQQQAPAATQLPISEAIQCAFCRTLVWLDVSAVQFAAPHAPGVTLTLCAKCVFSQIYCSMITDSMTRELADIYRK